MAALDLKDAVFRASTATVTTTKAEAKLLEGKCPLVVDGIGGNPPGTRLLLKDQTKEEQNGLWETTKNECFAGENKFAGGSKFGTGTFWALGRPVDADSPGEVTEGMLVPIEDGDTNQRTSWVQKTPNPIEVGTTAQTFEEFFASPGGQAGGFLSGHYSDPSRATGDLELTEGESITWGVS